MIKQILLFSTIICSVLATELEQVSDDELLNLFRTENYVVVLFSKKDCKECDLYEKTLVNIREDIVETMSAWVVKNIDSNLVKLYSPTDKPPVVVFFRHGIPLLFHDEVTDDIMFNYLMDNREPIVRELSDDNFESITQAATGATTGDWFVMFYSNDCVDCQRLVARWEAVGAKLKTRMNVARVNRYTSGQSTARRFRVGESPYFLFFRLGKLYHYNFPKYDVPSFITFAKDGFRNAKSERVPLPKAPFDDLTLMVADYLRDNPWLWKLFSATICIGIVISVLSKYQQRKIDAERRLKAEKKAEKLKSGEKSSKDKLKKSI